MTSTGLPTYKQTDKEEQKCLPPHSPSHQPPQWMYQVHDCGHPLGIQQYLNQGRWQRKSSISHPWRIVWTISHVLWSNQLPSNISNDDEHYLPDRSRRRMAISIHGWYHNSHSQVPIWNWRTTHHLPQRICPLNDKLEEHNLYFKPEKCQFKKDKIEYLRVTVGKGHLQMSPKKLQGIADWSPPKNLTEVWSFLGFTGYYRYFIPNYSKIAWPLLDLIKKTTPWHWGEAQHKAFEELKTQMCGSPVLIQPDMNKQFTLHIDTSAYGMGTILSQEGSHTTKTLAQWHKPILHPVAYYSATFMPTEWNYNIYERELLAIMKALTHWRHYLGWTKTPFIICTDQANLQYWKSPRNLNCQTARWHTDLQEYDYILEYIPGKTNTATDALSQPPGKDHGEEDNKDITIIPPHWAQAARTLGGQTIVPNVREVRRAILQINHDLPTAGHPGRDETLRKIQEHYWWPGIKDWIAKYVRGCTVCQQSKILTHKKQTPLYHISTEENMPPFQVITMDLITGLPMQRGLDAILTIIDHGCSRAVIFLPCSIHISGAGVAQLYLNHMYLWYRLP